MMQRRLSHIFLFFILVIYCGTQICAQGKFQYVSQLSRYNNDGWYRVQLHPSICGLAAPGLADLRLVTRGGQQVPYILDSSKPSVKNVFVSFPILSSARQADRQTHIIVLNVTNYAINELVLISRNAQANRSVTLSGSKNQKDWFVIKENIALNPVSEMADSSTNVINFPPSRFRYFQVTILGKDILPLDIFQVGSRREQVSKPGYFTVAQPTIKQRNIKEKSIIDVYFDQPYLVDRLAIEVAGAQLFNRRMTISNGSTYGGVYGSVRSGVRNSYLTDLRTNFVRITIENGDSPPLTVTHVTCFTRIRALLAFLKKDDQIQLYFGDHALKSPEYDLTYFRDSLLELARVNTSIPRKLTISPGKAVETFIPVWALWIVLAVILALLVLFTRKMLAEVSSRKPGEHG